MLTWKSKINLSLKVLGVSTRNRNGALLDRSRTNSTNLCGRVNFNRRNVFDVRNINQVSQSIIDKLNKIYKVLREAFFEIKSRME